MAGIISTILKKLFDVKELAYAGGAFAIANKVPADTNTLRGKSKFIGFLEKLAPYGRIMFAITMTSFQFKEGYLTDIVCQYLYGQWFIFDNYTAIFKHQ